MEGAKTPMGDAGNLRPRRLAEEAQVTLHGKRSTWNGNLHSFLTELNNKQNKKQTSIQVCFLVIIPIAFLEGVRYDI